MASLPQAALTSQAIVPPAVMPPWMAKASAITPPVAPAQYACQPAGTKVFALAPILTQLQSPLKGCLLPPQRLKHIFRLLSCLHRRRRQQRSHMLRTHLHQRRPARRVLMRLQRSRRVHPQLRHQPPDRLRFHSSASRASRRRLGGVT